MGAELHQCLPSFGLAMHVQCVLPLPTSRSTDQLRCAYDVLWEEEGGGSCDAPHSQRFEGGDRKGGGGRKTKLKTKRGQQLTGQDRGPNS